MSQKTTDNTQIDSEMTFTKAMAELDAILRKLQSSECDIDSLTTLTRRATALITFCRGKLTATDAELRAILTDFQDGASAK